MNYLFTITDVIDNQTYISQVLVNKPTALFLEVLRANVRRKYGGEDSAIDQQRIPYDHYAVLKLYLIEDNELCK